jgi:ABC-type nitrate/sulfonate/bicarbonate transport system permease component
MSQRIQNLWNRAWFPLLLVLCWQVLRMRNDNPFFPRLSKIWDSAKYVVTPDWLISSLGSSLFTLLGGYVIGSVLGIFFGAILGAHDYLREIFLPISNFIRCIPSVAKVPVVTAILGLGLTTRVATVSIAVLFPVLLSTLRAVGNSDARLIETSKLFGFGFWRTLLQLRLPAATGEILAGLQAALQVAVLIMVVSEMLGSGVGLGAFIIRAQSTFMIPDMWLGIFILGLLGIFLNATFHFIERRFAPWYFDSKASK